jgi:transposase
LRWSAPSAGVEARAVTSRRERPFGRRTRRTSGLGRRDGGRLEERRRACGDDQDLALCPPFRDEGQDLKAANQLQALRVTAPEELRRRLRGLSTKELVSVAARFRLGDDPRDVPTATKFALRSVARRYEEALSEEIAELEAHLDRLVAQAAPELVSLPGIGTDSAATLLVVAGDNPQRLRSEASFASLCGVSPIEASSGKVVRHRLNRGGNREANRALYMICLARMRRDRLTQEYVARRTKEGKSKREIIRCLKRYVAREAYRVLISCGARSSPPGPRVEAQIAAGGNAA